jgi:hypothetical protein
MHVTFVIEILFSREEVHVVDFFFKIITSHEIKSILKLKSLIEEGFVEAWIRVEDEKDSDDNLSGKC